MKRLLMILLGITLSFAIVGCESGSGNETANDNNTDVDDNPKDDPIVDLPEDGLVFSQHLITYYLLINQISCEHDSQKNDIIYLNCSGDSATREMLLYLSELNGDTSFNRRTLPWADRAFAYPFDDITMSCDKDFDSAHPAGEPLDDIVNITIVRYWDYVQNGYQYPEGYEYVNAYGLGAIAFNYKLEEINSDNSKLVSCKTHYLSKPQMSFTTTPDIPGEYTFTLSLTTNGETYTTTFTHTFE